MGLIMANLDHNMPSKGVMMQMQPSRASQQKSCRKIQKYSAYEKIRECSSWHYSWYRHELNS